MKTIVVQIGNSDDKLSQRTWALFILDVKKVMELYCKDIHFSGGSSPTSIWQNYCIVGSVQPTLLDLVYDKLFTLTVKYKQDSIAVTTGDTKFI